MQCRSGGGRRAPAGHFGPTHAALSPLACHHPLHALFLNAALTNYVVSGSSAMAFNIGWFCCGGCVGLPRSTCVQLHRLVKVPTCPGLKCTSAANFTC